MDQKKEDQKVGVASVPGVPSPNGGEETHCPICGRAGDPALMRFGQLFCSEPHVEQYATERRARTGNGETRATAEEAKDRGNDGKAMACGIGTKGGLRKMGWCLAGGVGLLIAVPLIASGGLAATAGSLLSVAAFLACPIGMYFMMRGMMKMNQDQGPKDKGGEK